MPPFRASPVMVTPRVPYSRYSFQYRGYGYALFNVLGMVTSPFQACWLWLRSVSSVPDMLMPTFWCFGYDYALFWFMVTPLLQCSWYCYSFFQHYRHNYTLVSGVPVVVVPRFQCSSYGYAPFTVLWVWLHLFSAFLV